VYKSPQRRRPHDRQLQRAAVVVGHGRCHHCPLHPPPWLFGLTGVPYGVGGGFAATTMPFLARKAGISVGDIGWYGTALLFPPIIQFLYAPIVDIGPPNPVMKPAAHGTKHCQR